MIDLSETVPADQGVGARHHRMTPGAVLRRCLIALLLATSTASTAAEVAAKAERGDVELTDFHFAAGGSLDHLKLHYLTLGTPHRDNGVVTNAVVLLHGTTGSAATFLQPGFQPLFALGGPLDTTKWFVVIPDGIGAGQSSKPSDGLHARFPRYGYKDQVRAAHDLLGAIGVTRLRLVLGTSMGGMQTWLWAEAYPTEADAFVAIASTPTQISGRNAVWREMISQAIRDDPDWKSGDYSADHPPHDWIRAAIPLFAIMTGNADTLERRAPTRAAAAALVNELEKQAASRDANDFLYTFESSTDYDPAPQIGAIRRPFLAINFADDLLNPPSLLHLPTAANVSATMLPGGDQSFGHETLAHADRWAPALQHFLSTVPGWQ